MRVFKIIASSYCTEEKHKSILCVVEDVNDITLVKLEKTMRKLLKTRSKHFFITWFDGHDYCTIRETCDLQDAIDFFDKEGKADKVIHLYVSLDSTEHKTIFGEKPNEDGQEKTCGESSTPIKTQNLKTKPSRYEIPRRFGENDEDTTNTKEVKRKRNENQGHEYKPMETAETQLKPPTLTQTSSVVYPPQFQQGDYRMPLIFTPHCMMPPEMMTGDYIAYYGYPPAYQAYPVASMYPQYGHPTQQHVTTRTSMPSMSTTAGNPLPTAQGFPPSSAQTELSQRESVATVSSVSNSKSASPAVTANPPRRAKTPAQEQRSGTLQSFNAKLDSNHLKYFLHRPG